MPELTPQFDFILPGIPQGTSSRQLSITAGGLTEDEARCIRRALEEFHRTNIPLTARRETVEEIL